MAARVTHVLPDPGSKVGPSVQRDAARLVNHLVSNHDEPRNLKDLVSHVVPGRQHGSEQSTSNAPIVGTEIFEVVEWMGDNRVGEILVVGAPSLRDPLSAFLGERRKAAIRRLHDQRCLTRRRPMLAPV